MRTQVVGVMRKGINAIYLIAKYLLGIILGIAWYMHIPIYGLPFGGCDTNGFLTLEIGCSNWPDFFRGFGFIGLLLLFSPKKYMFILSSFVLLLILGYTQCIREFSEHIGILYFLLWFIPIIAGGLIALVVVHSIKKLLKYDSKSA